MVDEQQPGARVDEKVAKRVEKQIAVEIRHSQAPVRINAYETGPATTMRYIDLAFLFTLVSIGCDEECVGARYDPARLVIQLT